MMRASKLIVGESYRHKDHPKYCWCKVVEVKPPSHPENPFRATIVKCEYSQNKNDAFAIIKHFKPSDLIEP